jgi:hypothetical protein
MTNLLPILEHGGEVWDAGTRCSTVAEANELYEEAGGSRDSDYLLRSGRLYSLRDPRSCSLRALIDVNDVTAFAASNWSKSEDPVHLRYWVELLRRTLLQQLKRDLWWHPERHVFYFASLEPLAEVSIEGPTGRRKVVKVKYFFDKKLKEERLAYIRHHAFRPGFRRIDGRWHLEIEPDYLFTSDGRRESRRAAEHLSGIKRLDRNLAVIGQLRMWAHLLTRPPSLLVIEPTLLTFGELPVIGDFIKLRLRNPACEPFLCDRAGRPACGHSLHAPAERACPAGRPKAGGRSSGVLAQLLLEALDPRLQAGDLALIASGQLDQELDARLTTGVIDRLGFGALHAKGFARRRLCPPTWG